VINLQEVWTRSALEVIRANLPSFPYVAWRPGIGRQPAGGLATFSRHPIGRVSYTSYFRAVPPAGGLRFRLKRALNTFLQGVLVVDLPGPGVTIANTHLTANKDGDWSAGNRYFPFQAAQLRRLHAAVPATDRLTVLTGGLQRRRLRTPLPDRGRRWAVARSLRIGAGHVPPGVPAARLRRTPDRLPAVLAVDVPGTGDRPAGSPRATPSSCPTTSHCGPGSGDIAGGTGARLFR
jgi:hypothetical protein